MKTLFGWYHAAQYQNANKNPFSMNRKSLLILGSLLALMALTRTQFPGIPFIVPDASWAVFLLGGFFLRKARYFVIFALVAWGLDIFSVRTHLAAAYCITPGYAALVVSWIALWFSGQAVHPTSARAPLWLTLGSLPAVALAFVISNLGYYLYSSYGAEMTLGQYSLAVSKYLPFYLATTTTYVGLLSALVQGAKQLRQNRLAQA